MDPFCDETFDEFNEEFKNDSLLENIKQIIIWCEDIKGKKKMTFMTGWDIEKEELKNHLKILKKRLGCNGSIKNSDEGLIFQLQGDKIDVLHEYLLNNNIEKDNIYIKG